MKGGNIRQSERALAKLTRPCSRSSMMALRALRTAISSGDVAERHS